MIQGFYEQLGVSATAAPEELRDAYRKAVAELAKRRKALLEQGGDTSQCDLARQQVDEAWSVLSDPALRRRYDAMRALDGEGVGSADELWEKASGALVAPATAAAADVVDAVTGLGIGKLPDPPKEGQAAAPPAFEDAPTMAGTVPTMVPESATQGASVVPLPTAGTVPADSRFRVVDGEASSVIVLQGSTPPTPLSAARLAALVKTHGFGGGLLKAVRTEYGIELQKMSDTTRISVRYLDAIESEAFDALPSATFVRGYVREMARLLQLDEHALVAGYMQRLQG